MNRALVWLIAGILYVVIPWDFDWVPLVGWVDDVLVLAFTVYAAVNALKRRVKTGPAGARRGPQAAKPAEVVSDDPYAILGVARGASPSEIKAAFRKKIAEYHPDKVAHLGSELKELAEEKAKAIQRAYDELNA